MKNRKNTKRKKHFNHNHITNAKAFLKDLETAKKESESFEKAERDFYEIPEIISDRYLEAMQNLGRWLVEPPEEENDYLDALESIGDRDF
jgi:hypothetical protein